MDVYGLLLLVSLVLLAPFSAPQPPPSFQCMTNNATCQALVGYVSKNTTTLSHIQSLFQVKTLSSLLAVNLLPPSTPENYTISRNQTVKIPFPCRCNNGTGISDRVPIYTVVKGDSLYYIATQIFSGLVAANGDFSGLVAYQQIQTANQIKNASLILVGQHLWVPLPCSCDDVEGQKVVHYALGVQPGSTLDQIAAEFGTTTETLVNVNNITDPSKLEAGQVIDVPLKGQVLQNLATPSEADGAVMKKLASALSPVSGWSGTDFCIWSGVVCNSNGFVTSISLPSQNLSGSLPSDISSLSQLTTISFQNNQLSGPLPTFANLTSLQEIHLDSNNFTSVPDGAFLGLTRLQNLSLEDNPQLSPWAFPAELADSKILVTFYASNVNLIGQIPNIFGSLTSLQNLRLSYNILTGPLPDSLSGTQMENLWIENQHPGLSGPLDVLSRMTLLKQVWLQDNNFFGPIPDLSNCTGIFDIQLQNNLLTGVVPASLISLPKLANISLQSNKLQGSVPVFPESVTVTLGSNMFCRDVPGNCDPQVSTLLEIAGDLGSPLKIAEAWGGNDACNKWPFVTCDASKNIIILNLSKQGLSGIVSPAIAKLTFLSELYFNGNNLTGTIPESLTTLRWLKTVNLSNNDLRGQVPRFRSTVVVDTAGNKNIGGGTPSKKSLVKKVLLGVVVSTILIATLMMTVYAYKKRRYQSESPRNADQLATILQLTPDTPVRFTYHTLKMATNNFDMHRKLGGGGFGTVFEGSLNDGTRVAVKRLDHSGQGMKEFLAEVQTIGNIHHVNLVKLVGFCAEKLQRLLVYEHMSNGSLDKWIFKTSSGDAMAWNTKKKIILHIAKGLAYLHEGCQKTIAHLDVKPQNVLLDEEFNAKLSDFGLAKLIDKDQSYVMTQMRGTRGYLAPEWLGRQITEKVDVYSYGVVVLEVVFGRKNLDLYEHEESNQLIHMVKKKNEASQLFDLLDKSSEDVQQNAEEIEKTIKLAIWCLHTEPVGRPAMSTVVKVLEGGTIPEVIEDYSMTILSKIGNPTIEETTHISGSVLSGPR